MMIYTVKTFNQSITNKKVNDVRREAHITLPFTVVGLGLSDNIILLKKDFTMAKAKARVVEKVKIELARLAEHKEYQIEV